MGPAQGAEGQMLGRSSKNIHPTTTNTLPAFGNGGEVGGLDLVSNKTPLIPSTPHHKIS